MMISPELAMLDTNAPIYVYYEDALQYPAACLLLDPAQEAGASLIFGAPPNLSKP
jgi:hypothetical protein